MKYDYVASGSVNRNQLLQEMWDATDEIIDILNVEGVNIHVETRSVIDVEALLGTVVASHVALSVWPPPELRMSLHEARVLSIDTGLVKPITARLFQEGDTFDVDCYVTQDMVDAFLDGKLAVNDWVLVYFIDHREDKAIVQQKIFKTW